MKDFSKRDYFVAAGIILGVLGAWFLLMAFLMNAINPEVGLFLVVAIGCLVWWLLSRKKT